EQLALGIERQMNAIIGLRHPSGSPSAVTKPGEKESARRGLSTRSYDTSILRLRRGKSSGSLRKSGWSATVRRARAPIPQLLGDRRRQETAAQRRRLPV